MHHMYSKVESILRHSSTIDTIPYGTVSMVLLPFPILAEMEGLKKLGHVLQGYYNYIIIIFP